jgi:hypothetical protein
LSRFAARVFNPKSMGTITTAALAMPSCMYGLNNAARMASVAALSSDAWPLERSTRTSRTRPSVSTTARTWTVPEARACFAAAG